jgi:hypothetical protein
MRLDDPQAAPLKALLEQLGVPFAAGEAGKARVVVVSAEMDGVVQDLARSARDQVIMARVDKETVETLDRWIAAGLAKSRSEAAAVFIKEGLNLRASELQSLSEALEEVEAAKSRLSAAAARILGTLRPPGAD